MLRQIIVLAGFVAAFGSATTVMGQDSRSAPPQRETLVDQLERLRQRFIGAPPAADSERGARPVRRRDLSASRKMRTADSRVANLQSPTAARGAAVRGAAVRGETADEPLPANVTVERAMDPDGFKPARQARPQGQASSAGPSQARSKGPEPRALPRSSRRELEDRLTEIRKTSRRPSRPEIDDEARSFEKSLPSEQQPTPALRRPVERRVTPPRQPAAEERVTTIPQRAAAAPRSQESRPSAQRQPTEARARRPATVENDPVDDLDEVPVVQEPVASPIRTADRSSASHRSASEDSAANENSTSEAVRPSPTAADRPANRKAVDRSRSARGATEEGVESTLKEKAPSENVLFTQQVPQLKTQVVGPRKVIVGRAAPFRVSLRNTSNVKAVGVVVVVPVPPGADLVGATPTSGTTDKLSGSGQSSTLQWKIDQLMPGDEEHLEMKIMANSGQPLELAVTATYIPPAERTLIEVQEPKLEILVTGPDEVLFGTTKRYKLTLTNPGTGPAENVVVDLLGLDGSDEVVVSQKLAILPAGDRKEIEVELVAREAGQLRVAARAVAHGGLKSMASKNVLVRRAELNVTLEAPSSQYAGTVAAYRLIVANPGTANAGNVKVSASLPSGAEFVAASDSGQLDESRRTVTWNIGTLAADTERPLQLECLLKSPGSNRLDVLCRGDSDLSQSSTAATDVIGLADLTLDVGDPSGPVAVGSEAEYEVRIANRGTQAAESIDVVVFFSEGVEPLAAQGVAHELGPGQVVFRSIDTLAAGEKMVLKVRARGTAPGNHVFRAEVRCRSLETKLAAEETTLYYVHAETAADASPRAARRY